MEHSQEPEVLTPSVLTDVSRLWQQSNARKGTVNIASSEKAARHKTDQETEGRQGKVHVVKAKLLQLQLDAVSRVRFSRSVYVNRREVEVHNLAAQHQPALPSNPPMNDGKERKEDLICTRISTELKTQDCLTRRGDQHLILHGNRTTIIPKVQAVMAWAARKQLAVNEV
jgi:hypothetical protein